MARCSGSRLSELLRSHRKRDSCLFMFLSVLHKPRPIRILYIATDFADCQHCDAFLCHLRSFATYQFTFAAIQRCVRIPCARTCPAMQVQETLLGCFQVIFPLMAGLGQATWEQEGAVHLQYQARIGSMQRPALPAVAPGTVVGNLHHFQVGSLHPFQAFRERPKEARPTGCCAHTAPDLARFADFPSSELVVLPNSWSWNQLGADRACLDCRTAGGASAPVI
jgi:hypothetical protein